MGKIRVFGRPVPMFLACREDDDIPGGNHSIFLVSGNDAFSSNDDSYSIPIMRMKSVSRSFAKINDI
jgi:hypothetical protein